MMDFLCAVIMITSNGNKDRGKMTTSYYFSVPLNVSYRISTHLCVFWSNYRNRLCRYLKHKQGDKMKQRIDRDDEEVSKLLGVDYDGISRAMR